MLSCKLSVHISAQCARIGRILTWFGREAGFHYSTLFAFEGTLLVVMLAKYTWAISLRTGKRHGVAFRVLEPLSEFYTSTRRRVRTDMPTLDEECCKMTQTL